VRSVESSSCSRTLRLIFKQTVVLNLLGRESLQWLVLLLAILHTLLQSNLAQLQIQLHPYLLLLMMHIQDAIHHPLLVQHQHSEDQAASVE